VKQKSAVSGKNMTLLIILIGLIPEKRFFHVLNLQPKLFHQESLLSGGKALVGRCKCGCEGCDDYVIEIIIDENEVEWKSPRGYLLSFNKSEYESEILAKSNDHSWEDNNRTAERLVDAVFYSVVLSDGWSYDWASPALGREKFCFHST
jgi:hypothetical protein